jgi:hypothetical protein
VKIILNFRAGSHVFSGGCVAHGVSISIRRRVGKMLIQNLSKIENRDKFFGDNQAESLTFFHRISEMWDAMCVCVYARIKPKALLSACEQPFI